MRIKTCSPNEQGLCSVCGQIYTADTLWQRCLIQTQCCFVGEITTYVKITCSTGCNGHVMTFAAKCERHRRCLPGFQPNNEQWDSWQSREESKLFSVCSRCPDFTMR